MNGTKTRNRKIQIKYNKTNKRLEIIEQVQLQNALLGLINLQYTIIYKMVSL